MGNHVIKDRIWRSQKLRRCSREAALAYPWIFLVADDWGRFEYDARLIWSQAFGAREDVSVEDVEGWLAEFARENLLERYHIDGELAFWTKFEGRPPSKRRPSQYPDPEPFKKVRKRKGTGTAPVPLRYPLAERSRAEQSSSGGGSSGTVPLGIRIPPCDPSPLNDAIVAACREIGTLAGKDESEVLKAFSMVPGKNGSGPRWITNLNTASEPWRVRTHQDLQAELSRLKAPAEDDSTRHGLPTVASAPWNR